MYVDLESQRCFETLPEVLVTGDQTFTHPTLEAFVFVGRPIRRCGPVPETPAGHVLKGVQWVQDPDNPMEAKAELMTVTEEEDADEKAQAYADRVAAIPPELWQKASVYRTLLRRYFGANAETNREVTATAVAQFFIARIAAGTGEQGDAESAMFLTNTFSEIAAWTGDGTSWTFPWSQLPE